MKKLLYIIPFLLLGCKDKSVDKRPVYLGQHNLTTTIPAALDEGWSLVGDTIINDKPERYHYLKDLYLGDDAVIELVNADFIITGVVYKLDRHGNKIEQTLQGLINEGNVILKGNSHFIIYKSDNSNRFN